MPTIRDGKRLIQVTLNENEYQILRKEAYKMEKTVNQAILLLALKALEKKK